MMYYRRKLLLSIIAKTEKREIGKINLQKFLFLISQKQSHPYFDFVPYQYGCFSFQANKDLDVLSRHYQLLKNNETKYSLINHHENYFDYLKEVDQDIIDDIFSQINVHETKQLIDRVYDSYPYYTINSQRDLTPQQEKKCLIEKEKTNNHQRQLFSIGYEGLSIDAYLNQLLKNDISLLCDVRKNPFSMKYGFSKYQLSAYCKKLKIKYIHFPALGIDSLKRKEAKTTKDYEDIFDEYKDQLPYQNDLKELKLLFERHQRLALTCFEKDYQSCHRGVLLNYYISNIEDIECTHL